MRRLEVVDARIGQRRRQARALAGDEAQILADRVGDDEDVGKQDRAVEGEAAERLERDLGRGLGIVDQVEEAALARPQRAIFGQIAPGLAHQPDRRRIAPLAAEDGEQGLVGGVGCEGSDRARARPPSILPYIYIDKKIDGV